MSLAISASIVLAEKEVEIPSRYVDSEPIKRILDIGRFAAEHKERNIIMKTSQACAHGQLELVMEYRWRKKRLFSRYADTYLREAIGGGDIRMIRYMLDTTDVRITADMSSLFKNALYHDHLDVAMLMQSEFDFTPVIRSRNVFGGVCNKGLIDVARWMMDTFDSPADNNYDLCFRYACYNGHLGIAKLLYDPLRIDPMTVRQSIRKSCLKDHLSTAKWLYGLGRTGWPMMDRHDLDSLFGHSRSDTILWAAITTDTFDQYPMDVCHMGSKLIKQAVVESRIHVIETVMNLADIRPSEVLSIISRLSVEEVVLRWLTEKHMENPLPVREEVLDISHRW